MCVHALSAFILGSIKALTCLCSCSGQELSLAADLILLRRICVFVCVCVGENRSVQEVTLAIERDG